MFKIFHYYLLHMFIIICSYNYNMYPKRKKWIPCLPNKVRSGTVLCLAGPTSIVPKYLFFIWKLDESDTFSLDESDTWTKIFNQCMVQRYCGIAVKVLACLSKGMGWFLFSHCLVCYFPSLPLQKERCSIFKSKDKCSIFKSSRCRSPKIPFSFAYTH